MVRRRSRSGRWFSVFGSLAEFPRCRYAQVASGAKTVELPGGAEARRGVLRAGAYGVVCSGLEAKKIHAKYGDRLRLVIPGIRAAGGKRDDQKRAVTASEAAKAGAAFIVLGRMVTEAADPRAELRLAVASI